MEVHEGPKGPLFMVRMIFLLIIEYLCFSCHWKIFNKRLHRPLQILSMDGSSFSGQTPDIAWDMFQRKGCLHTKIWHGKRSSCKVDGVEVELFSFNLLSVCFLALNFSTELFNQWSRPLLMSSILL